MPDHLRRDREVPERNCRDRSRRSCPCFAKTERRQCDIAVPPVQLTRFASWVPRRSSTAGHAGRHSRRFPWNSARAWRGGRGRRSRAVVPPRGTFTGSAPPSGSRGFRRVLAERVVVGALPGEHRVAARVREQRRQCREPTPRTSTARTAGVRCSHTESGHSGWRALPSFRSSNGRTNRARSCRTRTAVTAVCPTATDVCCDGTSSF